MLIEQYQQFIREQAKLLGAFDFDGESTIWHYTDGKGLLGIVETGTIYSTQVACLNDSTEIRYGSLLFQKALTEVLSNYAGDERVKKFLTKYLKLIEEVAANQPSHAPSLFFVACFSGEEDSLSQWKGENHYAIAFKARQLFCPPNLLLKVNYDRNLHETIAANIAAATVKYYEEGLVAKNEEQIKKWEDEFLSAWDTQISYLAPLVKDPKFKGEKEYRIVHEFTSADLVSIQIIQKKTMMTRHLPLSFPLGGEAWVPRLPVEKVMIGPSRHPSITGISVDTLLRKMGYGSGKIVHSTCPLQET